MGPTREQRLANLRSALADAKRRHAPTKAIQREIERITAAKIRAEMREERKRKANG